MNPDEPTEPDSPVPSLRRPGAPKNNVNAAKDPAFTLAMRAAQRLSRKTRAKRHAAHLAEAKRMVTEAGYGASPIAANIARRIGEVEAEIEELGIVVDRIGRTKRDGTLCPPYERRLNLIGQDRQELRQLLDRLIEREGQGKGEGSVTEHSVFLLSGAPLPPGVKPCASCGAFELPMASTGNAVPPIPGEGETEARLSARNFFPDFSEKEPLNDPQ